MFMWESCGSLVLDVVLVQKITYEIQFLFNTKVVES